jgi:flagellin-like protein
VNFRKFRKLRKDIKAISPVISVLLMIAIAVVASLVVYAWVMGYIGFQTGHVGKAVQIQSISRVGTTGLNVYVQNVGDSQISLTAQSVYVNGTQWVATPTPASLTPGATSTVAATGTIAAGDTVTVKVTSTDGTFSQVTQTLP